MSPRVATSERWHYVAWRCVAFRCVALHHSKRDDEDEDACWTCVRACVRRGMEVWRYGVGHVGGVRACVCVWVTGQGRSGDQRERVTATHTPRARGKRGVWRCVCAVLCVASERGERRTSESTAARRPRRRRSPRRRPARSGRWGGGRLRSASPANAA